MMPKCDGIVLGVIGFGLAFLSRFIGVKAKRPTMLEHREPRLKKKGGTEGVLLQHQLSLSGGHDHRSGWQRHDHYLSNVRASNPYQLRGLRLTPSGLVF
jgi:hypothetical protein